MDVLGARIQTCQLCHTRDPGYFHKDQFSRTEHTTASGWHKDKEIYIRRGRR
ncbi:hypothetical protein BX661DRAFT_183357 [Kickxella alabastrina]|uniref:uncharacterized protein n=1 Tax=Kickxella alabastrina TaxID=61397 RepID=UPI00221EB59C|nr:uncharacterized protein BX661DRAFT_183357 [Kickxella alabastrina]KAI7826730.1 hypothetical protein BX661DRAFT_183357 [Kickxella alabastrina]